MADVLCIGTTGMLAGCVRSLITQGHRVACIARTHASLDTLACSIPESNRPYLSTHPCDYRDLARLAQTLDSLPFEPKAAICWVHSPAEPVLDLVRSRFLALDLLRVIGSSTSIPESPEMTSYRTVRLGFVVEGDRSRWLSNDEISEGVYRAFASGESGNVVGVIEPWDKRP